MPEKLFGFLPINKPSGLTSRRAVDEVKKLAHPAKVGHTGTLDPLAEGVLVICVGPATRLATFVQQSKKSYVGTFRLGVTSETDDSESELNILGNAPQVSRQQIECLLPEFTGKIMQIPPEYSAIKVKGKRAYQLARQGKEVHLEPREVHVHDLQLLEFDYPTFKLKVGCGAGTYIRSIGRDLGQRLGSGAAMTALTRTSVGNFSLEQCIELDAIKITPLKDIIVAPRRLFPDLPVAELQGGQVRRLIHGDFFTAEELQLPPGLNRVVALDENQRLLALLQSGRTAGQYRIEYNFANHYSFD